MVRLNAGSTPAPGTHAGMRQSVSCRTKTVQYVNDSPVRPHRSPACRGATAGAALEFRCSRFDSGQGHFRIPVSTPPPVLRAWGWAERWSAVHLYGSFAWFMPSSADIRTLAVLAQRLVPQPSTLMMRVRFPHTARYDSTSRWDARRDVMTVRIVSGIRVPVCSTGMDAVAPITPWMMRTVPCRRDRSESDEPTRPVAGKVS